MTYYEPDLAIQQLLADLSVLGNCLWQKGWAERNAGNISINITGLLEEKLQHNLADPEGDFQPLDRSYPLLSNACFLVSATGKRMRDLAAEPEGNVMLICLNSGGDAFRVIPFRKDRETLSPTSELPTHLSVHEQLLEQGSPERALLHTHPDELIALTQIREFCREEELNRLLWGMHPETAVFIPAGAGLVPYMLPGSEEIARATVRKFEHHKVVIWEKHGCLAVGKDVFEAFDLIDTLAKSASVYFKCRSVGHEPEGLSPEKILELKALSSKFLK